MKTEWKIGLGFLAILGVLVLAKNRKRVIPILDATLPIKGIRSYLYQRSETHKHRGIDLPAKIGTPVLAADNGIVVHAYNEFRPGFSGYGRVIVLEHPDKYWTLYAHLDSINVKKGDKVNAGDEIGQVGVSAFSTDNHFYMFDPGRAHLHFEVSRAPYPQKSESIAKIDPVAWLNIKKEPPPEIV